MQKILFIAFLFTHVVLSTQIFAQETKDPTKKETVLEQKNVPENSDYLAPPSSYNLLGVGVGFTVPTYKQQNLIVNFEINNVLNTVYRDYLNRFRYYSNEMGRNYSLKLKLTF